MWPVRTAAECRYRQIISLGKPAAQCYGGNVSADPLCSGVLLRTRWMVSLMQNGDKIDNNVVCVRIIFKI